MPTQSRDPAEESIGCCRWRHQAREIRHILDHGAGGEDTWPIVAAEAERLAEDVLERWRTAARPNALRFSTELDVVCSGGGWRNMYCGGAYSVLRVLERRGELVVCRAAGASSGALAAATIGCNSGGRLLQRERGREGERDSGLIPCRDWYRLHDAWDVIYQRYGFGHYCPTLRGFIRAFYPHDAHARCSASGTRFSIAAVFAPDDASANNGTISLSLSVSASLCICLNRCSSQARPAAGVAHGSGRGRCGSCWRKNLTVLLTWKVAS